MPLLDETYESFEDSGNYRINMQEMWSILESLLRQARIGQSRSSVVNPLQWTLVILISGLLALVFAHAPEWLIRLFAYAIGLVVVLLVAAYLFFMIKNPDALRSEKFSLMKTAMEKKVLGDSLTGLMEAFEGPESKALVPSAGQKIEPGNDG